jgi:small-conductance mechanosensitive channel
VQQTLLEVANRNPLVLDEPEPIIVFKAFGQNGINVLFGVWFERTNYLKVKNSVFMEIKEAFEKKGIEIPFPHISLYAGEATKPFPVEITGKA